MRDFWLILRVHLHTWLGGFGRRGSKGLLRPLLQVLIYLALTAGVAYGTHALLQTMERVLRPFPRLAAAFDLNVLLALALATVALLFTTSLGTVFRSLYESDDLAFLMSTPVPPAAVFGALFVESHAVCVISAVPFGLGPMLALGIAKGAGAEYYLVAVLSLLALVGLVVGLASIGLVLVMRYVPGQQMKQLVTSLGLAAGLAVVLAIQYASYHSRRLGGGDILGASKALAGLDLGDVPALPHSWLAHAALRALGEDTTTYLTTLLPLLLVALASMALVVWLSARLYLAGWSSNLEVSGARPPRREVRATAGAKGRPLLAGPFWGFVRKEFLLTKREPRIWYSFAVGIVAAAFPILNIFHRSNARVSGDFRQYFVLLMVIFGGTVGGNRLAGSALSREGATWHLLGSFPVRPPTIYGAKAFASGLPSLALSAAGVLFTTAVAPRGAPLLPLRMSLPIAALIVLALTSVMLTADVLAPDFKHKLATGLGARGSSAVGTKTALISLGSIAYLAVMGATAAFPTFYPQLTWFGSWSHQAATALATAVFVFETVGVAVLGYCISVRRLEHLTEES